MGPLRFELRISAMSRRRHSRLDHEPTEKLTILFHRPRYKRLRKRGNGILPSVKTTQDRVPRKIRVSLILLKCSSARSCDLPPCPDGGSQTCTDDDRIAILIYLVREMPAQNPGSPSLHSALRIIR
jgi:hypothetical protein